MVRHILSFLAALAIVPIAGVIIADNKVTPPAIVWEKTLEDALAKSKAAGKPVMLDFFVPT